MTFRRIARAALALPALFTLVGAASAQSPASYAQWTNGPWQDARFFPLAVWWQLPTTTGHSGPYSTLAAAAANAKFNIFLGQGTNWPESFGADWGELELLQQYGLYLIGGTTTPSDENSSARSVASMLSLATRIGAQGNLIGYNAGDEPQCQPGGQILMSTVPSVVAAIQSYDPTRMVTFNQADWMIQPQWQTNPSSCLSWDQSALQATSIGSFDYYPTTNPYIATQLQVGGSDFATVPNDALWVQGLSVQAIRHFARPGQPIWAYVESGSDNFGFSESNNRLTAGVTAGSTTLVNHSGWSRFTDTWIGLTVSGGGIPAGTTIVGVTDATHAVLSQAATGNAGYESVTLSGGANNSDCVLGANLCVVNGNEYRPTLSQVGAEVWMSIINGANGIEYFCHDSLTYSFCLDDTGRAGHAADQAYRNIGFINSTVLRFAPMLNAPTAGLCSMQQFDYSHGAPWTTTDCSDGILSMATLNPSLPGMALAKSYNGATYLFAQSDRRSDTGGTFRLTLAGLGGHSATVIFDSNERYDRTHNSLGTTFALDGSGQFSDILGANHDDYQVKIYRID